MNEETAAATKQCRKCDSTISRNARVCPVCQKDLGLWGIITKLAFLVGVLVSVGSAWLAFSESKDATKAAADANLAANSATEAVQVALSAKEESIFAAEKAESALVSAEDAIRRSESAMERAISVGNSSFSKLLDKYRAELFEVLNQCGRTSKCKSAYNRKLVDLHFFFVNAEDVERDERHKACDMWLSHIALGRNHFGEVSVTPQKDYCKFFLNGPKLTTPPVRQ